MDSGLPCNDRLAKVLANAVGRTRAAQLLERQRQVRGKLLRAEVSAPGPKLTVDASGGDRTDRGMVVDISPVASATAAVLIILDHARAPGVASVTRKRDTSLFFPLFWGSNAALLPSSKNVCVVLDTSLFFPLFWGSNAALL